MPTRMYIDAADFISRLDQSGLLSDKIRTRLASAPAFTEAAALAEQLVGLGLLTRYQVDVLLGHRNDPLVLDTYAILEPIGAGGMGRVYRARHLAMDRIVAIKVLPTDITADPRSIERFQREIRAAARLRHPSIVRALDAGEANGVHFLVMEHVDGVPLSALVRERGPLPVGIAVNCIQQAAAALESAHEQGVVHRDVKPSNLMLDRQGMVQVLDMGLALCRAAGSEDPSLTASGAVLGTIDFMAPEQAADPRHADRRADIYSLGCTLFFLLTGRPPYAGGTAMQRLLAHRDAPIPALREARPDVSAALDAVFRRMVAKQPDERYATMADLLAALNACGPWPTSSAAEVSLASTRDFVARPQPAESELSLSTVIRRAAEEATAPGKRRPAHSSTRQNWPWQPWQIGAAAAVALAAVCIGIVVFWRPGGNKANTDKPQTSIPRKADKPSAEPDLTNRRDVAPAAKSPDISRGLLAHWTFDETGDDARDSSGQSRHATIHGAKRVEGLLRPAW